MRDALQHVLDGHLPYPAMVMDGFGELIAPMTRRAVARGRRAEAAGTPVNVLRVALHAEGVASRTVNLDDWRLHILHNLRQRGPHPRIDALIEELEGYGLPTPGRTPVESVGFAVPLHLRTADGDARLIATFSTFVTALDVTLLELRLEAFLPADHDTAEILSRRSKIRHPTDRDEPSVSAGMSR